MSTFTYCLHDYTDIHDVDEDRVTIPIQSGYWCENIRAGVVMRGVNNAPTDIGAVASKK